MMLNDDLGTRTESIDELKGRAADAPRSEDISAADVISDAFVSEYTEFASFNEMVRASPSNVESAADLELVADSEWDEFVANYTAFENEEELVMEARDHWVSTQLGLNS